MLAKTGAYAPPVNETDGRGHSLNLPLRAYPFSSGVVRRRANDVSILVLQTES